MPVSRIEIEENLPIKIEIDEPLGAAMNPIDRIRAKCIGTTDTGARIYRITASLREPVESVDTGDDVIDLYAFAVHGHGTTHDRSGLLVARVRLEYGWGELAPMSATLTAREVAIVLLPRAVVTV